MKKLVALAMLLLASPVYAQTVTTSGTATPSHTALHNHTIDIADSSDRNEFGYGVGADAVIYRSTSSLLDEVRIDTRYDIENRETRVFAVAKVDLYDYLTNR